MDLRFARFFSFSLADGGFSIFVMIEPSKSMAELCVSRAIPALSYDAYYPT